MSYYKDINYLKPVLTKFDSNWTEIFPTGQDCYILPERITTIIKALAGEYTLVPAPLTYNRELDEVGIGYLVLQKIVGVIRLSNYPDRCLVTFTDDTDALCWCSADSLTTAIEQAKGRRQQHILSIGDGEYLKETEGIYLFG